MMQKDDEEFVSLVADAQSREKSIRRWRRSRMLSFIAFGCLFLFATALFVAGNQAASCGLFSGIAAINFAVAVSTDLKIKVALLTNELKKG